MKYLKTLGVILVILLVFIFQNFDIFVGDVDTLPNDTTLAVYEDEAYSTPEHVAMYIFEYGKLPNNYLTKDEALDLGWLSHEGNLWDVAEGMSIGGDRFYNREKLLPEKEGRVWFECDINYEGGYRNAERIVYSNDGLVYYTSDHYESFEEITKGQLIE
jgi:hypothetical protein